MFLTVNFSDCDSCDVFMLQKSLFEVEMNASQENCMMNSIKVLIVNLTWMHPKYV